jgi:hypothetical protein
MNGQILVQGVERPVPRLGVHRIEAHLSGVEFLAVGTGIHDSVGGTIAESKLTVVPGVKRLPVMVRGTFKLPGMS